MLVVRYALLIPSLLIVFATGPSLATPLSDAQPPNGLFFKTDEPDVLMQAPPMASDMTMDVNGIVARAKLHQSFRNPSDIWLEGVYVFPLPDDAAVDRMAVKVGERRIVGRIMEKEEARRTYEAAAAAGKHAGLLASERPNVFVTSVANIPPGETVEVEIEFQAKVGYEDGRFTLRLPTVVAPRYGPPDTAGTAHTVGIAPEERRDLFGGFRDPADSPRNTQSFAIDLDPGFEVAGVESLYHPVVIEVMEDGRRRVSLAEGEMPANRDFVLEWRPVDSMAPSVALFSEEVAGETFLLGMVVPPLTRDRGPEAPARDVVFVIDTSGSMHGASIAQAKTALRRALGRLGREDRFNVIRFANETHALFRGVQPATAKALAIAERYVDGLEADGGTEMRPALELALSASASAGRLRQVVFVTDGAISYEDSFFRELAGKIGETRLFTVGIGSAPNQYFMHKAAELGRGSATFIGDTQETAERMGALFDRLEAPALTGLAAAWPGNREPEAYPTPLPDLYVGEPLVFLGRLSGAASETLTGDLVLSGHRGPEEWSAKVPLSQARPAVGVAKLWAREKFDEIVNIGHRGGDTKAVRRHALEVALAHQLVTRYTSLVAVDDSIARPGDEPLATSEVPRDLPHGWSEEKVFGTTPAPATPAKLRESGLQPRRVADDLRFIAGGQPVGLPQTATPAPLHWLLGALLVLLGLIAFAASIHGRQGNRGRQIRG